MYLLQLNTLFFQVLARKYEERSEEINTLFDKVPYLNSSLFEPTEMEHNTLFVSNLRDNRMLPIMSGQPQPFFEPHSDVYSLTIVMYECLTHEVPFHEFDKFASIDELVVNEKIRPKLPMWIPKVLRTMFDEGWHQNPKQRITAQTMLEQLIGMYQFCGFKG